MEAFEPVDLNEEEEQVNEPPLPKPVPKSPRNYAELKAEFKKGKGVRLTKEESKIYWKGKLEDAEAVKLREEVAMERFWSAANRCTANVLTKILFYAIYGLWTATPIAGIVIGLIYIRSDNCPGQPSIAPLLIILGLMSILVGFSLVSQQKKGKKGACPLPAIGKLHGGGQDETPNGIVDPPPQPPPPPPPPPPIDPIELEEEIELGPISEETYTLAETMGVCAGGFLVCFIVVFKFVHLILFIATSVIVYRFAAKVEFTRTVVNEEELEQSLYCNEVLFRFAFWSVTLALVILGLLLGCCLCGCFIFVGWTAYASREPPEPNSTSAA